MWKKSNQWGKNCTGYIYNHSRLDLKGVVQSDPQTIRTLKVHYYAWIDST